MQLPSKYSSFDFVKFNNSYLLWCLFILINWDPQGLKLYLVTYRSRASNTVPYLSYTLKNYFLLLMYRISFCSCQLTSRLPQTPDHLSEFSRAIKIQCIIGKTVTFSIYLKKAFCIPIQNTKIWEVEVHFK